MRLIKNKKLIVFVTLLGIFIAGEAALAKELAADPWPPTPLGTGLSADSELPHFIQYLYEWGISLGGLAVFIALLIAGFQYLSSAGNPAMMKEARDRIVSALLGLALLLGSWLILNTINPQFTTFHLPPLEPGDLPEQLATTTKEVAAETEKMAELLDKSDLCKEAIITGGGGISKKFPAGECKNLGEDYFATNEEYHIQGKPISCVGTLLLFPAQDCERGGQGSVATYFLMQTYTETLPLGATNIQSGRLDVPDISISFWDMVKGWFK